MKETTRAARAKIHLANYAANEEGCWLWQGTMNHYTGYGRAGREYAHRFFYEKHVGAIPAGLTIDHLCRVKQCVNPAHLEAVTLRENLLRSENPPAIYARRSTCDEGHEFTLSKTGIRECLPCRNRRSREQYYLNPRADRPPVKNPYGPRRNQVVGGAA